MLNVFGNLQLQTFNSQPADQLETNLLPNPRRAPTSLERPAATSGQRQGAENSCQEVWEELEKAQGPSALIPGRGEDPGKGQSEKTSATV